MRIRIDQVPEDVPLVAGMTATVMVNNGVGTVRVVRGSEPHAHRRPLNARVAEHLAGAAAPAFCTAAPYA